MSEQRGPEDFDDEADWIAYVEAEVDKLCTPEYLALTKAWIMMWVQLKPEVELGPHSFRD